MSFEQKVSNVTLTIAYTEERTKGAGPRSIEVVARAKDSDHKVTGTGKVDYKISPNPHDNPKYNNSGQPAFYRKCAEAVASHLAATVKAAAAATAPKTKEKFGKPAPKAKATPSVKEVTITWPKSVTAKVYNIDYHLSH